MIKKKMPTATRGKKTKKARMEEMAKKLRRVAIKGRPSKAKDMSPGKLKAMTGSAVGGAGAGMGAGGLGALARKFKLKRRKAQSPRNKLMKRGGKAKK